MIKKVGPWLLLLSILWTLGALALGSWLGWPSVASILSVAILISEVR